MELRRGPGPVGRQGRFSVAAPSLEYNAALWPKTILCRHSGARLQNGRKTGLGKGEIAKDFGHPSGVGLDGGILEILIRQ